ncbi:MAG: MATE family efflux transporter [Defluviitaleaceae bacterium]|nr:MATE family efflux transporter [Defluviitaleaceae bacterium]
MKNVKNNNHDLTNGKIFSKLLLVAAPIMLTSMVQMLHNLMDMFFLGLVGAEGLAAAGTAGMYLWLSMALLFICRMGAEVGVSQNVGSGDYEKARQFAENSIILSFILGILFSVFVAVFRVQLVGFFNIPDQRVVYYSEQYLLFISPVFPFMYVKAVMTGIYNGYGNAKLPMIINSAGFLFNLIITPIFIFVLNLGVAGAAISTTIAYIPPFFASIWALKKYKNRPFEEFNFFIKPSSQIIKKIFKIGTPMGVESALFTFFTMFINRFIASYGVEAIAVNRVGTQLESLTWLVGGGFATAVTAFIGQNYGAKKYDRLKEGFRVGMKTMFIYGLFVSIISIIFARPLMSIFLHETNEIALGVSYMRILAFMQLVACLEGVAAGAFRGKGNTIAPSITSVTMNALRVLIAYFLSLHLGLYGIWWGVVIGANIRGLWVVTWYYISEKKMKENFNDDRAANN